MANPLWDAWRRRTPNYGNIYVPPLPPIGQRTSEQEVGGGLPPHRLKLIDRWSDIGKSPNLTKWGSMPSSPQYDSTMDASAGSGKPTSMFKNPFGKMSPEELKDFQEVLKEMRLDIKPEFVAGGNYGRTQEYSSLPYAFDESSMAEMQKRKKLFPFLA